MPPAVEPTPPASFTASMMATDALLPLLPVTRLVACPVVPVIATAISGVSLPPAVPASLVTHWVSVAPPRAAARTGRRRAGSVLTPAPLHTGGVGRRCRSRCWLGTNNAARDRAARRRSVKRRDGADHVGTGAFRNHNRDDRCVAGRRIPPGHRSGTAPCASPVMSLPEPRPGCCR